MSLHDHANCKEIVRDNFVRCGHDVKWVCCESIQNLKCEVKIDFFFYVNILVVENAMWMKLLFDVNENARN